MVDNKCKSLEFSLGGAEFSKIPTIPAEIRTNPVPICSLITEVKEVVDAALFLTDATFTSGEILHVDGVAHAGKW
jgi:hypothetical protein